METDGYQVGEHENGGCYYRVTVRGLTIIGWRRGTKEEVTAHAQACYRCANVRAKGEVINRYRTGERRPVKNGRITVARARVTSDEGEGPADEVPA